MPRSKHFVYICVCMRTLSLRAKVLRPQMKKSSFSVLLTGASFEFRLKDTACSPASTSGLSLRSLCKVAVFVLVVVVVVPVEEAGARGEKEEEEEGEVV